MVNMMMFDCVTVCISLNGKPWNNLFNFQIYLCI